MKRFLFWQYQISELRVYSGKGFTQGTGFDVTVKQLEVRYKDKQLFTIVLKVTFHVEKEWMRNLKKRWREDAVQQENEQ